MIPNLPKTSSRNAIVYLLVIEDRVNFPLLYKSINTFNISQNILFRYFVATKFSIEKGNIFPKKEYILQGIQYLFIDISVRSLH